MSKKPVLLVVDDDRNTREGLERALKRDYEVVLAESAERAIGVLAERSVDAVLSDIRMPGMDGLTFLQRVIAREPQPVCIMMTAYGSIDTAVEAMKSGAADYVTKPYNLDDLEMRLAKALRSRGFEAENERLQKQLDIKYGLESIKGNSGAMQEVFDVIRQAAPANATVFIVGESGTGKELVARAVHRLSPRAQGPFVPVHCGALSSGLMESELFGHEKGSFTGAHELRRGRFELADGGTMFLDEVSEIDIQTQARLLRVLEERSFERVGGSESIPTDMRLIAATNRDPKDLMDSGQLRQDLYFRLNVVSLVLPPLRDRLGDVPLLCEHFLHQFAAENGKDVTDISAEAVALLSGYPWPGNVRELRNTIEKMVVLARGPKLTARDVPPEMRVSTDGEKAWQGDAGSSPESMDEAERLMITHALKAHGGNKTNAAKQLGISRRTLHRKLRQYQDAEPEG